MKSLLGNHSIFFAEKIEPTIHCGKEIGYLVSGSKYVVPYPINELSEWTHNLNNCKGCRDNHAKVMNEINSRFTKFPDCCEWHKKLLTVDWFDKKDFKGIGKQYADKLFFSWFHIIYYLDTVDWKKEIFDYLEYVIFSFGDFPNGYGSPLYLADYFKQLKGLLQRDLKSETIDNNELEKRKKEIIEYLDNYFNPNDNNKNDKNTDWNVLIDTYNKWLKIFPFQISFFQNLKSQYEKNIPILNGKPETNKYTGIAKAQLKTKDKLIESLLNITNTIITQINTTSLYEKGQLTNPEKIKLELVLAKRKMKISKGYVNTSPNEEQRYRRVLKEWFCDEKELIEEITPILKSIPLQSNDSQTAKENKDGDNSYPNIFTDKGYQLWLRLFDNFKLTARSQTDIKFCFEKMKKDNFIYSTVKQADFLRWLNDLRTWDVQKPNSTVNLKDTKRVGIYDLSLKSIEE